jgi:Uma2 family endonuclease
MSASVQHAPLISPDEFLAGEKATGSKHEYLNGLVYAMAGGTVRHSAIGVRLLSLLYARLRGSRCQPYNSDLLLSVRMGDDLRYYYPDATIHYGSHTGDERVLENPNVIFEVLSEYTARTDTGEKRLAYLTIPTLEAYVLVDSDRREVTVWRQTTGQWAPEVLNAAEAVLEFTCPVCQLTVGEIYEGTGL